MVFVEGFLLFYHAALSSSFDAHIWLDADCETCLARRHQRDSAHKSLQRFSDWYRDLVWRHYEMNREVQLANAPNAFLLDCKTDLDTLVSHCREFVDMCCSEVRAP